MPLAGEQWDRQDREHRTPEGAALSLPPLQPHPKHRGPRGTPPPGHHQPQQQLPQQN